MYFKPFLMFQNGGQREEKVFFKCLNSFGMKILLIQHIYSCLHFWFIYSTDASLEWETIEQYFVWQLIAVHSIAIERIMPILPKLDFSSKINSFWNSVPASSFISFIKQLLVSTNFSVWLDDSCWLAGYVYSRTVNLLLFLNDINNYCNHNVFEMVLVLVYFRVF